MKVGSEVTFYENNNYEIEKKGTLYFEEAGKCFIEFKGSFLDAYKAIKLIHAEDVETKERYTLINCYFRQSNGSTYRFASNETYKGEFLGQVHEANFRQVTATISGLTNWINQPRIKPEIAFSKYASGNVVIKEFFEKTFEISSNLKLEICEFCAENYSRNKTILQNRSYIRIIAKEPVSRLELYKNVAAFLKFLSLFTSEIPTITSLEYVLKSETTVEALEYNKQIITDEAEPPITFDKLEENWQETLTMFYADRDRYCKVIDLLIASIENTTAEISFLNITTAMEVMHKYFFESIDAKNREAMKKELLDARLIDSVKREWTQIMRYNHLFIKASEFTTAEQYFSNRLKAIETIKDSRNFYTHYSNTKKFIWTPNQLFYINRSLRQLLTGLLLRQLQIPLNLVNLHINTNSGYFYHDYERNEFSVHYIIPAKSDISKVSEE